MLVTNKQNETFFLHLLAALLAIQISNREGASATPQARTLPADHTNRDYTLTTAEAVILIRLAVAMSRPLQVRLLQRPIGSSEPGVYRPAALEGYRRLRPWPQHAVAHSTPHRISHAAQHARTHVHAHTNVVK